MHAAAGGQPDAPELLHGCLHGGASVLGGLLHHHLAARIGGGFRPDEPQHPHACLLADLHVQQQLHQSAGGPPQVRTCHTMCFAGPHWTVGKGMQSLKRRDLLHLVIIIQCLPSASGTCISHAFVPFDAAICPHGPTVARGYIVSLDVESSDGAAAWRWRRSWP